MPAFNFSCARRTFREIEDDTEAVANFAHNLKIGLFRHGTNSLKVLSDSPQNKAAKRNMIA
jgi:hypothetical protein